jgi:hypothetical protein
MLNLMRRELRLPMLALVMAGAVAAQSGCGVPIPLGKGIIFVDRRGGFVLAADVEIFNPRYVEAAYFGFPPLVGEYPGSWTFDVADEPVRVVVRAVGFLPFDELVDARVSSEVVLQDDPNPVAECEGKCANEVACGGQGAGAGEDACVQACLADLALTGDDLADACRPLRVVQAYCLGLLTCDGFLAFQRGEPNDCTAIPTAIADCEANGAYGP